MKISTPEQQIQNLERRIRELNVFLKTEKEPIKVKKYHQDIESMRNEIKELKSKL